MAVCIISKKAVLIDLIRIYDSDSFHCNSRNIPELIGYYERYDEMTDTDGYMFWKHTIFNNQISLSVKTGFN